MIVTFQYAGLLLDLRAQIRGGGGCNIATSLALIAAMVMMIVMVMVVVNVMVAIVVGKWFLFIAISALQTGIAGAVYVIAGRTVVVVAAVTAVVAVAVAATIIVAVAVAIVATMGQLQAAIGGVALLEQRLVQRRLDDGQLIGHHILDLLLALIIPIRLILLIRLADPPAAMVAIDDPLLLMGATIQLGVGVRVGVRVGFRVGGRTCFRYRFRSRCRLYFRSCRNCWGNNNNIAGLGGLLQDQRLLGIHLGNGDLL